MQVFLDMIINPSFWKHEKMIYVREKSVQNILGISGQYASFMDFIDQQSKYKLAAFEEMAFRKKPSEQNTFDKEIMKVDERVNIWMSLMDGGMLRIFPLQGSANNTWISFVDSLAGAPLTGRLENIGKNLRIKEMSYNKAMRFYLQSVFEATKSGDYSMADNMLEFITLIQRQGSPPGLLPAASRINLEISYNKSHIFDTLRNCYGLLSVILLILAFIDNLRSGRSRLIRYLLNFFIALLGAAFLYHTYGMGVRWVLSGHAPWSNGYEALLVISWGSLLAGFCFVRNSKITVAATSLLAFIVLMTAGYSNYDPQLTNLQPVLKSYWLVIHVAVITISYGFLALGFILGLINLFIFLFKTGTTAKRLGLIIRELTLTNEMTLTIGLFMATAGTFLGGVWASESWGKYWGWDAKETWALVIVITYAIILHLRLVPKFNGAFIFNTASVIGFGSVIMTFVGVNYYLSKGLHSYAADEKSVFPLWGWIIIGSLLTLILAAGLKEKLSKE
jgi:cytochrome c-type biogenesis protein CcsB